MADKPEFYTYANLEGVVEEAAMRTIFYFLQARIAAGMENHDEGAATIVKTMGEMWNDAAYNTDELARLQPAKALELGLHLCLLPADPDPQKENIYKWLRGDGPIILTKDDLREPLEDYFTSHPEAPLFTQKILDNIAFNVAGLSKRQAFNEANCFLAVASMYLGTKLRTLDHPLAQDIAQLAVAQLQQPDTTAVVRHYQSEPDTAWLAQELEPFLAS